MRLRVYGEKISRKLFKPFQSANINSNIQPEKSICARSKNCQLKVSTQTNCRIAEKKNYFRMSDTKIINR